MTGSADLRAAALAVRERAYAPYSNFLVGAAVRTADGQIFAGCNVENVAYPEGTCAEAGALAAMCAAGAREIVEVYVVGSAPSPVPPCGGCRQKLKEFGKGGVPVTMGTVEGAELRMTLAELLPGAFGTEHME
ncbi:MAG: cytidine deaminase [Pseudomonadota bacterium]